MLRGQGGDDLLGGEAGRDVLYGGAGADAFVCARGGAPDRITDFALGQRDALNFNDALWSGRLTPAQVVSRVADVTAAGVQFDFGSQDRLLLARLTTISGLAALIDIA